jgi:hypothetical protein
MVKSHFHEPLTARGGDTFFRSKSGKRLSAGTWEPAVRQRRLQAKSSASQRIGEASVAELQIR